MQIENIVRRRNEKEGRIIVFWDKSEGQCNRHKLDFDSPRTLDAACSLGITFEECVRRYSILFTGRPKSEFFLEGVNPKIAEMRYKHYHKVADENLKKVYAKRNKLGKILAYDINSKERISTARNSFI